MDKVKNNFGPEQRKEADPHIVEGRLYKDPIAVCYRIGDIIYKILASEKNMSEELNEQCLAALELSGTVRDSCYIKNDSSARVDNSKIILSLSNALKKLLENNDFLNNYDSLSFEDAKSDYSWTHDNLPGIKTKEELKKILQGYVDLLNYFSLESYPISKRKRQ